MPETVSSPDQDPEIKPQFMAETLDAALVASSFASISTTLRVSRDLMKQSSMAEPRRETESQQLIGRALSASERATARKAVDTFHCELNERIAQFIEEKNNKSTSAPSLSQLYPLPAEIVNAAYTLTVEEIYEEVFKKYFSPFGDDYILMQYATSILQDVGPKAREILLGESLLPKLVATLEDYLAALIRSGLRRYPKGLGELPDIPYDVVQHYGMNVGTADLHRWAIDKKVADLISGSPAEWCKRIANWTKIDLSQLGADWGAVLEVIQRRHAIIHNSGRVDGEYLSRTDKRFTKELALGQPLICDSEYMMSSISEIKIFAELLAVHWAAFMKIDPYAVIPSLNIEIVDHYERNGLWQRGEILCRTALESKYISDSDYRSALLLNSLYCRQQMEGEAAALLSEIQEYKPSSDYLALGKAILLRDQVTAVALTKKFVEPVQNKIAIQRTLRDLPLVARGMNDMQEFRALLDPAVRKGSSPRKKGRKR